MTSDHSIIVYKIQAMMENTMAHAVRISLKNNHSSWGAGQAPAAAAAAAE